MRSLAFILALAALAGCAEVHQDAGRFTATGTSANLLFFQIPRDPMLSANSKVPPGAAINNVNGSPNDWHTVAGFFNRLIGIGWTQIGGTTTK